MGWLISIVLVLAMIFCGDKPSADVMLMASSVFAIAGAINFMKLENRNTK